MLPLSSLSFLFSFWKLLHAQVYFNAQYGKFFFYTSAALFARPAFIKFQKVTLQDFCTLLIFPCTLETPVYFLCMAFTVGDTFWLFVHDNNNNNNSRSLKSCVSALALHWSVFSPPISYYTSSLLCKKCPYQHNYCFKHTFLLLSILFNFNCATNLLFTLRKQSN